MLNLLSMNSRVMTDKLQDWQRRATEQARNLGHVTDGYIRDNTWVAIATAAALGCVLGFVLTHPRESD